MNQCAFDKINKPTAEQQNLNMAGLHAGIAFDDQG
jgi:hypothetical protein